MEPLFVNRTSVNKKMMEEWFKEDIKKNHRIFRIGHICLMAAFVVLAGALFFSGAKLGIQMFTVLAIFMLVLAALFFLNMIMQPRIQVWLALRRDKEGDFETPYVLVFYPAWVVMVRNPEDANDAAHLEDMQHYLKEAEGLQNEFTGIVENIQQVSPSDDDALLAMKEQLEALQTRMDGLNKDMGRLNKSVRFGYDSITDYFNTPSLHVIYFGGQAMLVAKEGFEQGTEEEFKKFAQMLAAIAVTNAKTNPKQEIYDELENEAKKKKGKKQ